MKHRFKALPLFLFLTAFFSAALLKIHFLNLILFRLAGNKSSLNGVWKSRFGDIAFRRLGDGPPLLLVHGIGIGAGSVEWESNISGLSKTRTVYALDLPGFGNSEKKKMAYNCYYYATVINGFIRSVIGCKADVAALHASSGIVLAGASLEPALYERIVIVNPYESGMGAGYKNCAILKTVLPLPVIGTLVYNHIAKRQKILSYLEHTAPVSANYAEIEGMMKKMNKNARLYGANNKYSIISFISGYMDTSVFRLMENCPKSLAVIVSGESPVPMLAEKDGLTVIEIKSEAGCPNVYDSDKFNEIVLGFFGEKTAV